MKKIILRFLIVLRFFIFIIMFLFIIIKIIPFNNIKSYLELRNHRNRIKRDTYNLVNYYKKYHVHCDFNVVKNILCTINNEYENFKLNDISKRDLIAILMIETTGFDKNAIGMYDDKGSIGIAQICPEYLHELKLKLNNESLDPTNEKDAILIMMAHLEDKVLNFKTRKNSIIAYNGYVIEDGKLNEKYWNKFLEKQKILNRLFPNGIFFEK